MGVRRVAGLLFSLSLSLSLSLSPFVGERESKCKHVRRGEGRRKNNFTAKRRGK
jgi:hypothetical protein